MKSFINGCLFVIKSYMVKNVENLLSVICIVRNKVMILKFLFSLYKKN